MPTYEYACESCGHEFEREQRITEDPIKECPKCGKQEARRMIGGGNFILKGGGWESDLYSGASNRKPKSKPKSKDSSSSKDRSSSKDSGNQKKPKGKKAASSD